LQGPTVRRWGWACRATPRGGAAIAGHRSDEIEAILGYPGRAALVHRDDMAL
jgi:glutamate 5-kinase